MLFFNFHLQSLKRVEKLSRNTGVVIKQVKLGFDKFEDDLNKYKIN